MYVSHRHVLIVFKNSQNIHEKSARFCFCCKIRKVQLSLCCTVRYEKRIFCYSIAILKLYLAVVGPHGKRLTEYMRRRAFKGNVVGEVLVQFQIFSSYYWSEPEVHSSVKIKKETIYRSHRILCIFRQTSLLAT